MLNNQSKKKINENKNPYKRIYINVEILLISISKTFRNKKKKQICTYFYCIIQNEKPIKSIN